MNHERYSGDREILSNRHLKEWNDNLAFERQSLYHLDGKHNRERGQLLLDGVSREQEVSLKTQRVNELHELRHQQDERRIALRQRHGQEIADFD